MSQVRTVFGGGTGPQTSSVVFGGRISKPFLPIQLKLKSMMELIGVMEEIWVTPLIIWELLEHKLQLLQ